MYSPIALFTYDRPHHTYETLKALSKNNQAINSELFIFSDGSKENAENDIKIRLVRQLIHESEWKNFFKSVHVIERDINIGLAQSIIVGVRELCDRFGRVIVLEDDMITSPFFLDYMNFSLEKYEHEELISSVNAYMSNIPNLPDYFFLRANDCWGWGTWKQSWDELILDREDLIKRVEENGLTYEFNFNESLPYLEILKNYPNSWHMRWYATNFFNGKLGLYSSQSYVQNIGLDGSGTHSEISPKRMSDNNLRSEFYEFSIPLIENQEAKKKMIATYKKRQKMNKVKGYTDRLYRLIERLL